MWNISVSSASFQITILTIKADKFSLRWNWMHGFISCSPDKVEYLIPWNSCFQKYYLASQLYSLQKWWCWRKGWSGCAMLKGQLESCQIMSQKCFSPSFHTCQFLVFLRFKISLSYFCSSVFFYTLTYKLKKKNHLALLDLGKKVWFLKRSVSAFSTVPQLFSEPRLGPEEIICE